MISVEPISEVENVYELDEISQGASKVANTTEEGRYILDSFPNVNPTGGTENCGNCAIATDAMLAGRPASALQGEGMYPSELEKVFGGKFKPVSGESDIRIILIESGNGARGLVGARGPRSAAHVFNVININGSIEFIDGQTGVDGSLHFFNFDRFTFPLTNPGTPK